MLARITTIEQLVFDSESALLTKVYEAQASRVSGVTTPQSPHICVIF